MAMNTPPPSLSASNLKQPFQPKLQSIPSVSHIHNPFLSAPAPQPSSSADSHPHVPPAAAVAPTGNFSILTSLPLLVSLPLTVLATDLALSFEPASPKMVPGRAAVSCVQASAVMAIGHLSSKFKLAELPAFHSHLGFAVSLFLFFGASSLLTATRIAVVSLCLFMSPWNFYTPLMVVYDIYSAVGASSAAICSVVLGYCALLSSVYFAQMAAKGHHSATVKPTSSLMFLFISLLFLAVVYSENVHLSFLVISIATSSVILLSASEGLLASNINILLVAVFSYGLECFVFKSATYSFVDAALSVVVPALIRIQRSGESFSFRAEEPTEQSNLLAEILSHSDTRAIFNFLMLNTAFMFVQLLYSFRSKSLGLLSDSLHMALDCASLALGLVAGIWSKIPVNPNSKHPFGLRNFEILAGFANGTLLVGISGSIVFEAIGRLFNPVPLQQTTELIVVSILGLLVNIVGIFAFNHGHHGHSHSHGHSHEHSHGHSHSHSHSHTHAHTESGSEHEGDHDHPHSHGHSQKHDDTSEESNGMNDNMRGIFLHILADTLGSVGVVISTLLTKMFSWQGFDPVASIVIAVLIFLTAIPLMQSTASTLLLKLDTNKESTIRAALNDLTTIKGVKSFTTPRFWDRDKKLCGSIHIQVYRGENTSYLKKQCEGVFQSHKVDALIQMENDYDPCWCRP